MRRPTLFLTVGLPGTGKTTVARRLEIEHRALRLTKDEWVKALYGQQNPTAAQAVIEGRLIEIGGAIVEMHDLETTPAEQRSRLTRRQGEAPHTTWPMTDEELAAWATSIEIPTPGEVDGSEPIDDPPAGFATWDQWRGHRWPSAVS